MQSGRVVTPRLTWFVEEGDKLSEIERWIDLCFQREGKNKIEGIEGFRVYF